jgi:hypothetical protein
MSPRNPDLLPKPSGAAGSRGATPLPHQFAATAGAITVMPYTAPTIDEYLHKRLMTVGMESPNISIPVSSGKHTF